MKKIKIKFNDDIEMMSIVNEDGDNIFYGNYWDFDNSPKGIGQFLDKIGIENEVLDELD